MFIPKEDVVFRGVQVANVLEAIPDEQLRRMQRRILDLVPSVIYRRHGSSAGLRARKDAFDLAIDGVLQRIKQRIGPVAGKEPLLFDDDNLFMDGLD